MFERDGALNESLLSPPNLLFIIVSLFTSLEHLVSLRHSVYDSFTFAKYLAMDQSGEIIESLRELIFVSFKIVTTGYVSNQYGLLPAEARSILQNLIEILKEEGRENDVICSFTLTGYAKGVEESDDLKILKVLEVDEDEVDTCKDSFFSTVQDSVLKSIRYKSVSRSDRSNFAPKSNSVHCLRDLSDLESIQAICPVIDQSIKLREQYCRKFDREEVLQSSQVSIPEAKNEVKEKEERNKGVKKEKEERKKDVKKSSIFSSKKDSSCKSKLKKMKQESDSDEDEIQREGDLNEIDDAMEQVKVGGDEMEQVKVVSGGIEEVEVTDDGMEEIQEEDEDGFMVTKKVKKNEMKEKEAKEEKNEKKERKLVGEQKEKKLEEKEEEKEEVPLKEIQIKDRSENKKNRRIDSDTDEEEPVARKKEEKKTSEEKVEGKRKEKKEKEKKKVEKEKKDSVKKRKRVMILSESEEEEKEEEEEEVVKKKQGKKNRKRNIISDDEEEVEEKEEKKKSGKVKVTGPYDPHSVVEEEVKEEDEDGFIVTKKVKRAKKERDGERSEEVEKEKKSEGSESKGKKSAVSKTVKPLAPGTRKITDFFGKPKA